MKEIWKDIKGYEGLYQVSNLGRVKSLERYDSYNRKVDEKILKTKENLGYIYVNLHKNGIQKGYKVHRLVAEAFIPNPNNKPCVDHINTIKDDNRADNLRWVTYKENMNNPATKEKCSEINKGKTLSEEHKNKLSEALKGENNPMYGKLGAEHNSSKSVVQLTLDGELIKIWGGMREAEREEGFNHSRISECCRQLRDKYKGYKWMYYEDYLND